MAEVYKTLVLLDGTKVDVIIPRGEHISRANFRQLKQTDYDIIPFIMSEICLVNGLQKSVQFYTEMMCDDYFLIMESLNDVATRIK